MPLTYSKPNSARVNVCKILQNFLEAYPFDPEEVLVIEAIANSKDANARNIELVLKDDLFVLEDDGDGMSTKKFEENFAALAFSDKIKGESIGWAGIGGKLYLAIPNTRLYVESETNGEKFARELWCDGDNLWWIDVPNPSFKLNHRGIYYKVILRSGHNLTPQRVEEIVRRRFNAILLGLYGDINIRLNGHKIDAFSPEFVAKPWDEKKRGPYGESRFIFCLTKEELPQPYGVDIVVFGKSVRREIEQFLSFEVKVKLEYEKRIIVIAIADNLARILNTNKEDFNPSINPRLWASFHNRLRGALEGWLKSNKLAETIKSHEPDITKFIGEEAAEILARIFQDPSFKGYNPFLAKMNADTTIPSEQGDFNVKETEGKQQTGGTIGGPGSGGGVPTEGPDPGTSMEESTDSNQSVGGGERVPRNIRTGLKIGFASKDPSVESELVGDAIIINKEAPQYILAEKRNWVLVHVMRCAFFTLIEYREGSIQKNVKSLLNNIRDFYKVWAEHELK